MLASVVTLRNGDCLSATPVARRSDPSNAASPVELANWAITLVRGTSPAGLHAWTTRALRYYAHATAYVYLVADPFPGFRGWYGTYPVDLIIDPPRPQARWKTLLRLPLAIPAGQRASRRVAGFCRRGPQPRRTSNPV